MPEIAIPAAFMRGGTSKALMFHARDLPQRGPGWDELFMSVLGSPDPYGRQLNGMGGGVSSLSKVCIISLSERDDADLDYTFAQVVPRDGKVEYRGNCGNMSAAVGPFAVDEGLFDPGGKHAVVRIHNTNTGKLIRSSFACRDGRTVYEGDYAIPGIAGLAAPIRLDFLDPGGATTGNLLPTGNVVDGLSLSNGAFVEASFVDAANPAVFVPAPPLGVTGLESPDELEANCAFLDVVEEVRVLAALRMGLAPDERAARENRVLPYVVIVGAVPRETPRQERADLRVTVIAGGQPHRAIPLTVALCAAVAARINGTVVARSLAEGPPSSVIRIAMPSGVLDVDAEVSFNRGRWVVHSGGFYRTARRLFDGRVWAFVQGPA